MKVAHKFTAALIAGILLVHGISATVWILRETDQIYRDIALDEQVLGRALSHAVERIWRISGEREALAHVEHAKDQEGHVRIRWVWLDAAPGDVHAAVAPRDVLAPLAQDELVVTRQGDEHAAMYTYVPVEIPGPRRAAIEIADPLADEEEYLRRNIIAAVATAGLLVAICALLAWGLGYAFIGRPAGRLVRHAHRVGTGDLAQRLPIGSRDEFGQLASALNQMCSGLQDAHEQLRHADRLATVGTLAAGVAHELGTPINVAEGYAQLIGEDPDAGESAKANASLIDAQCGRMAVIIRDLLRFARRGGKSGGSTDLKEAARETLRMLEPLARRRSIQTAIDGEDGLVARIDGDQLQQVLTNVVVNGMDAAEGGTLELTVGKEQRPQGDYLCIRVEDSGSGMEEDTRRRIFEPFFTTKDVGEGTGLGLSVAFGIVRDHGGFIEVESELGKGSVFSIFLPPVAAA